MTWHLVVGLAAVVLAAGCGSSSSDAHRSGSGASGVQGRVTAGPTCPVERADQPCPPNPVKGARIDALAHERAAGSAVTDGDGRFAITLDPGDYVLHVVAGGMFPRCPDTDVHVTAGARATADIACDTGIR